MPQLKSGRHIGVMAHALIDNINFGTDLSVYAFVVAYRLSVREPGHLRGLLPVIFFREGEGKPPHAPSYASGFLVQDILSGKADLTADEIQEFRAWLDSDQRLNAWVVENFAAIDAAIRKSPIWQTELATGETDSTAQH